MFLLLASLLCLKSSIQLYLQTRLHSQLSMCSRPGPLLGANSTWLPRFETRPQWGAPWVGVGGNGRLALKSRVHTRARGLRMKQSSYFGSGRRTSCKEFVLCPGRYLNRLELCLDVPCRIVGSIPGLGTHRKQPVGGTTSQCLSLSLLLSQINLRFFFFNMSVTLDRLLNLSGPPFLRV